MKGIAIQTEAQAAELLSRAKCVFNAGDYSSAYHMFEDLAYFVCSEKASNIIAPEKLAIMKNEVSKEVALFAFCGNEALYEKSCELSDLFQENK